MEYGAIVFKTSVADPERFKADPDPTFNTDVDPDPNFTYGDTLYNSIIWKKLRILIKQNKADPSEPNVQNLFKLVRIQTQ